MFYLVQRDDAERFTVAADIDPTYAAGLKAAMNAGVEVLAYTCRVTPEEIVVTDPVEVTL